MTAAVIGGVSVLLATGYGYAWGYANATIKWTGRTPAENRKART